MGNQMLSGIYCIKNIENDKVYIGSSVNCKRRWKEHLRSLNEGVHINSYLQRAWNKYGEQSFKFDVVEYCEKNKLKDRESYWIDYYGGINSDANYNLMDARRNSPNDATRKKISESRIGIKLSEETKKKLSDYNKKHPNYNFTHRERTIEERTKISNSLKGHVPWNKGLTAETDSRVQKNTQSKIGVSKSEETKRKISETVKLRHQQGVYDYQEANLKKMKTRLENGTVRKDKGIKRGKRDPEIGRRISEAKLKANQRKRELGLPLRNVKTKEDNKNDKSSTDIGC